MAEERRKARLLLGSIFLFLGVFSIVLHFVAGTVVIYDKFDPVSSQVYNLFCTFNRLEFEVSNVISDATGENVTQINVTRHGSLLRLYSYNISQMDVLEVGTIKWKFAETLVFSSAKLEDGDNYVIENGRIVHFHPWGISKGDADPIVFVKIEKFRRRSSLDEYVLRNKIPIMILVGFGIVLTSSLFGLPFIEYYVNQKLKRK